jgi:hypothetical protein
MIDGPLGRRLAGIAAALLALSAGTALLLGSPSFAGGLLLGFALGATPFATWAWIASRGLASRRNRIVAALLAAVKLGVYGGALFLLVTRSIVNPIGVMAGVTAVAATVVIGMLLPPPGPGAKEAA